MATPSISKLNKARHKQGRISKQNEELRKSKINELKNAKSLTEEEHQERLQKLKEIGLIK
ncbi:MAG: hypothetical protein KJ646_02670 [Nanoarchaeota archaeon]|nr:hypothetical protein [Nanoarchaeota archaeon]MBU4116437.1 hypothetical protein [Nanoarchaeota archaeon]MBU4539599.1 hypothetical protein [Bacteroidota bacterium]